MFTVKEKGEKPNRKPYLLPDGFRYPNRHLKSRFMPRNLEEIVHS
jgi:hypothetical protein